MRGGVEIRVAKGDRPGRDPRPFNLLALKFRGQRAKRVAWSCDIEAYGFELNHESRRVGATHQRPSNAMVGGEEPTLRQFNGHGLTLSPNRAMHDPRGGKVHCSTRQVVRSFANPRP